jgi:hypothetical protein
MTRVQQIFVVWGRRRHRGVRKPGPQARRRRAYLDVIPAQAEIQSLF